jgi:hypothetical protein
MEINVPVEELRKYKLFVATPMYGGACAGMFARSVADLSALCTHYGIGLQFYFLFNESLITRARNYCSDEFMRSDATHLMFIDSDIGFNPHDVIALLAMTIQEGNQFDVIGGPYPKKCISWEKVKAAVDKGIADKDPNILERFVGDYVFNPKGGQVSIQINEPCEVLEIGTGFMMVKRETMKKFADAFPQYLYRPDHVRTEAFDGSREITMYFQAEVDQIDFKTYYESQMKRISDLKIQDPVRLQQEIDKVLQTAQELNAHKSKRYLSEDYWFCQKIQELGMKTWFCPWMVMQHVGTYIFGGSLADLASVGVSATADPSSLGGKKMMKA